MNLNVCPLYNNGDGTFGGRFPGDVTEEWTAKIVSQPGEMVVIEVDIYHVIMEKSIGHLTFKQEAMPALFGEQRASESRLYTADGRFFLASGRSEKAPLVICRVFPQKAEEANPLASLFEV